MIDDENSWQKLFVIIRRLNVVFFGLFISWSLDQKHHKFGHDLKQIGNQWSKNKGKEDTEELISKKALYKDF